MTYKILTALAVIATLPLSVQAANIADDVQCSPPGCVGTVDLGSNAVTSPKIKDGTITNVDISSTAAIDPSKIAGVAWTKYGYLGIDGAPVKPLTIYAGDNDALALFSNSSDDWYVGPNVAAPGFGIYDVTKTASRLHITTDGNIGIGTVSPQSSLHVYRDATASPYIRSQAGAAFTGVDFGQQLITGDAYMMNRDSGKNLYLTTTGTGDVLVANGYVGINTAAAGKPLTVNGGDNDPLMLQSNSNHDWYVGPNVAGQRFGIYDATDSSTKFKIQSNGDICLGSC